MMKFDNNHLLGLLFTSLYITFFSNAHLSVPITADSSGHVYSPTETIFLYCGASGNFSSLDGPRNWTGDINSTYFPLHHPHNNASTPFDAPQPTSGTINQTPYMKARLSFSQFTYKFNLTPGPKFIRFYFRVTSYRDLDKSKAVFSVEAKNFTLLKNFSTQLTAENSGQEIIFKEYCVSVDNNYELNITFTPSQDYKDSYAFINGIEIVSMPPNLYYPTDDYLTFVGQEATYSLSPSNALEMVYRINVGGGYISSGGDTGLYRRWSPDAEYLTDARPSCLPCDPNFQPSFDQINNYSAPAAVYQTARSMGLDAKMNQNYRLTWQFLVDSAFVYFVRLHFCEFGVEIQEVGNRVFEIYIDDQPADKRSDVISWSGGNRVPIYRDYVVLIGSKANQKKRNLSIALHPAPTWMTKYSDAILNGVEIFKVDDSGTLAGPNPDPKSTIPVLVLVTTKSSNNRRFIILVVVGVVSSFVVLSLLFFLFICRPRLKQVKETTEKSNSSSSLPSDLCTHFSLSEIRQATNNFDEVLIIGVGGFGHVYKGFINNLIGTTLVAIKRLNPGSRQGALEFKTEILMLSRLRYLHLVSLIGYCNDGGEMILVYDYMARGTLRDHLYGTDNPPLSWDQRLRICIGAALGLHHLHTGGKHMIIHRDVKTTNILLDEKWVAKVSDFGLSKVKPMLSTSKSHVTTVVKGSFGYLDPEYFKRQRLTEKSDVYSFGVVLCEVLCARAPLIKSTNKMEGCLATWARHCYDEKGTLYEIVDPLLKEKIAPKCLKKLCEVAISCLDQEGINRPSMSDVVWGLEYALQLQEEYDKLRRGICERHIDDLNHDE